MSRRSYEIISRYTTLIESRSTFYTDSNGRRVMPRVREFRPTYPLYEGSDITDQYYPVTSSIFIKDVQEDFGVAVLTDRSEGGSSFRDGQIELMVSQPWTLSRSFHPHFFKLHRRVMSTDDLGNSEYVNEHQFGVGVVARGSHYLVFGAKDG